MRILILSWRDPKHPSAGGAEQVVLEHAKGWIKAGNSVTWFSSRFKGSSEKESISGVNVVRGGYQYLGVQLAGLLYYLRNKEEFDFVVDQFHGIPFFTPLYVKKPKVAILQELAKKVWFLNELPFPLNLIVGVIGYVFEPIIFIFYKKVPFIVGSESAKSDLLTVGIPKTNITVVPHGVKLPGKLPKHSIGKVPVITFLGSLSKDKGIEDAIRAFGTLNKSGIRKFWVIGNGVPKYMEKLKMLASNLGLQKNIRFWGRVSEKKKFALLAKTSILVNPSAREGWGLVNIEANSVGVPVVAYRSAGLVDSVKEGESGVICDENNPENLAKETNELLNSKKKYISLNHGAKKWAKNFDWKISRQKSLELIMKITK